MFINCFKKNLRYNKILNFESIVIIKSSIVSWNII
jgi:hypothetical protein